MKPPLDLVRILLAHFLGDFLLLPKKFNQSKQEKKWKSRWIYIHSFLYSALITLAFEAWDKVFWFLPTVFLIHLLVDGIRLEGKDNAKNFLISQLSSIILLTGLWAAARPENFDLIKSSLRQLWHSSNFFLIALGYILILWPFGYLVGYLTKPQREKLLEQEARGLENAGFWIGCLERIFVYSFIIFGYPEGIAFVAAAKSIFRFGEIKDPTKRQETEYILIGTLISIGLAMLTGYVVRAWTGR